MSDLSVGVRSVAAALAILVAGPAPAQIFISPPDFSAPPTQPGDAPAGLPLPGASVTELRSAMIWNLRAAMNVARCSVSSRRR